MTETPETDTLYNPENGWTGVVPISYARKLERERNGLHALHNKNAAYSAEILELCGTLRKERDVLLQAIINMTQQAFESLMTVLPTNQDD